ncbi:monocarboxylate transporter 12-like isoform X1 [Haliotis rufescens]|uniref:monocarboxylate transporter 12-like isoform X1 n=2 Tax=Haliotis rufescens TaxID=6454 RepID=UPI00201E86D5|nr:monocarboxylate transporter 12-like isoform X1 [Haliotis rufescens]
MRSLRNTDGGWAWVILAATVFNMFVIGTLTISVGMFQDRFLQNYSGSTAYISLVCSLFISLQSTLGPVASVICNMFSIRTSIMVGGTILSVGLVASSLTNTLPQLLGCYGILSGLGYGIIYTPSVIAVGHYFQKKRVLANGIALSSVGVGMLSGPHLIGWLIDQFGWRTAMSTLGCITAQMVVTGSLIFPHERTKRHKETMFCCHWNKYQETENEDINSEPREVSGKVKCVHCRRENVKISCKHISAFTVLKDKILLIIALNYFMEMMGYSIQIVHLPSYVRSVGVPPTKVPSLFTAYGLTLTVARILGGAICNDKNIDLLMVYISCQGLKALLMMFMPLFAHGFAQLVLYQVLYGVYYGFSFILLTPIVVELFGVERLATVFGVTMCIGGMSYIIAPTIAGALYDITSSYSAGFHIGGSVSLLGSMVLFLIPILRRDVEVPGDPENNECLVVPENMEHLVTIKSKASMLIRGSKECTDVTESTKGPPI